MGKIKTIFDREFDSYFHTLYGYVFTAFILLVAGIYTAVNSVKNGTSAFELSVSNMTFIYLIAIPILSMRVFAEERKQKTEQLLYSLPVKMHQVVLGKYFALCAVIALPIAVMVLYPLLLSFFGKVDLKAAYCALIGFWLLGCAICAVCMFLSSLTDNQAVAAGTGFIVVLVLFFISTLASMIPSRLAILSGVLRNISPFDRYYSFLNGIFDLRSAIYLIAISTLFVVFTVMVMEGRRRDRKYLYYSLAGLLCVLIIILLDLNLKKAPEKITQLQMNSVGITDFSADTEKQVENLENDVSIYWICRDGYEDTFIEQTLNKFRELSDRVHVIKINPILQPGFAGRYTNKTVNENSLVVENGSVAKYIDYSDIYQYSDSEKIKKADFYCESLISNAIDYVSGNRVIKISILTGHGEKKLSDTFLSGLKNKNLTVDTLDLLSKGAVPEDCSCILVPGTPKDLTAKELTAISTYMNNGGRILLFSTYLDDNTPNWLKLVREFGMNPQQGIIVEGNANYFVSDYPYYILPEMHEHGITESMITDGQRAIIPLSQSIMPEEVLPENITLELLLSTSDAAYSKADGFDMKTTQREEGDLTGKFILGMTSRKDDAAMVWFPSSYILEDAVNKSVSGGNVQLLLNSISWLTETSGMLTAQPKHLGGSTLMINSKTSELLNIILIAVIPAAFLAYGIVVLQRRKHR